MRLVVALSLWQSALPTSAFVVVPRTTFTTRSQLLLAGSMPLPAPTTFATTSSCCSGSKLFMAGDEDDGEENKEPERVSFADAGDALIDQEDDERMEQMGDFDTNPAYQTDNIEKMRAAIRARAQDLGVEKSKVSQQYIEEAAKRAAQSQGDSRPGGLDLSQISSGNEPGSKTDKWDDSLPTMLYDPADELTEEEQAQADVVGELPIFEQAMTEIKASKWPDLPTVIREVAVMFVVVAFTATVIIGADGALREFYTNLGMIPRPEDIPGQLDDLDLPEGFTNNMNEEDLAKITDEMNKVSKSIGSSSSPSVNALLDNSK